MTSAHPYMGSGFAVSWENEDLKKKVGSIASKVDDLSMYLFGEKFRYDTTVQVSDIEARIFEIRRDVIGFPRMQSLD